MRIPLDFLGIPLYAKHGEPVWALLNLLLAGIGVTLMTFKTLLAALRRRAAAFDRKNTYIDNSGAGGNNRGESGGNIGISAGNRHEKRRNRIRAGLFVAVIAMAAAGCIVFPATQDTSRNIVLLDSWTLVHLAIIAAEVTAILLAKACRKRAPHTEKSSTKAAA